MLRIIDGEFSALVREEMKKEIRTLVEEKKRVYLLVPEQEALISEKEMAEFLPPTAPLYFEVTNFTRLSDTVFRVLGGVASSYSDGKRDALIMWRALTEIAPILKTNDGRRDINRGFVEKALSAYKEMRTLSLTSQELDSLAGSERITEKSLCAKLEDLAKISFAYKKLHDEKFSDVLDTIDRVIDKLSENGDFFAECEIYIDGFTSFTEPQYELISMLLKSTRVTVSLPISAQTKNAFEFSEIKNTRKRLTALADKSGTEKRESDLSRLVEVDKKPLDEVRRLLWHTFGATELSTISDSLKIYEATDPYEECDFIASDIKKKIMQGASPRDFAIVAHNIDKYIGIIDTSLENASLPYFISKKRDVSSFEAIKLIYTAMKVIDTDFEKSNLISYMKCGLSGISRDACDDFELYVEKWQIDKKRFTDGIFWNMSPSGYDAKGKAGEDELLVEIDKTRNALINPLLSYREGRSEARTVKEHAQALFDFLIDIALEEKIKQRCEKLKALSENQSAKDGDALWKIICDSLDALVDTLGELEIDGLGFENLLRIVISFVDIGKIPAHYDEIIVGSANMIRLREKKHVYLIGVNYGEFPATPKDSSYFTPKDKEILSSLNERFKEEDNIPYARELFSFSRAFASASESVTLLYSLRDSAFVQTMPSEVIARICAITKDRVGVQRIREIPILEKLYFPATAFEALDSEKKDAIIESLIGAGYSKELDVSQRNIVNSSLMLNSETTSMIYTGTLALSQSRIDQYVSCPLAYYLKYDLRLSEDDKAEFDARNIGTFIHSILENFFKEIHSPEELQGMTGEEREALVKRCAEDYLESVIDESIRSDKRLMLQLRRLANASLPVIEGVCEELVGCKFIPKYFELKIGDAKNSSVRAEYSTDDGTPVVIGGYVDRVDTYKSGEDVYVRVIDYKTGTKNFDPTDIDKGRNLQMFLYLKSIIDTNDPSLLEDIGVGEGGSLIPAGVIYVKTDMSDVSVAHRDRDLATLEVKKNQQRRGMILDDRESIEAMNADFIPVKFTKSGAPDVRSAKFLYTVDMWNEMMDKISSKITEISSAMKRGEISTTKIKDKKDSPCSYCKFKAICRKR